MFQRPSLARPIDFFARIAGLTTQFQGAQILKGNKRQRASAAIRSASLKKAEIISALLVHEAELAFAHNSALHDSCPRKNSFDVFFERWIKDGGRRLYHATNIVIFLAWIGIPVEHSQLLGKQVRGRSEEHTSELQSLRHLVCR